MSVTTVATAAVADADDADGTDGDASAGEEPSLPPTTLAAFLLLLLLIPVLVLLETSDEFEFEVEVELVVEVACCWLEASVCFCSNISCKILSVANSTMPFTIFCATFSFIFTYSLSSPLSPASLVLPITDAAADSSLGTAIADADNDAEVKCAEVEVE
jgi:hypothetical protein